MPSEPERLSPEAVRAKVMAGDATLVCAYEDEEKCAAVRLTGSITLDELSEEPTEAGQLVFYCS